MRLYNRSKWWKRKHTLGPICKKNLGMNLLLVSLNYTPGQMSQTGTDNLSNLIHLGFDCVNVSCSSQIWKQLMREAFYEYGNWAKAS